MVQIILGIKRIYIGTIAFLLLSTFVFAQDLKEEMEKYVHDMPGDIKVRVLLDSAKKYTDSELSKSLMFGEMAYSYFDDSVSDSMKINVYFQLFVINHMLGNYAKGLENVFKQQELLKKDPAKNEIGLASSFANLGEIYRSTRDYDNAINSLNKSSELFTQLGGKNGELGLSRVYDRFAAVYFELSGYKKDDSYLKLSEDYALKSIAISEKYNLISRKISNLNTLGAIEISRKNTDKALTYLLDALNASLADSSYNNRINIEINIAQCYVDLKEYNKAIQYAEKSYLEAKKRGITVYIEMASIILYASYSATGDYKNAFNYVLENKNANEVLRNEELSRTISMFEQKELNEKRESEIMLQKEKYTVFISGGIILVLLIVGGFILRQNSLKKINTKLQENSDIISSQKSELEDLNASRNKFFSILSHDLRNPFNGILGFLTLLKNDFDVLSDAEKKQYIGYVDSSANQLYKLLDRLLELSRLQDGRYKFDIVSVNLKDVINDVLLLQNSNARNKKVQINDIANSDVFVKADKNSLETILRNLTDNALKFTPAGGSVTIGSEKINDCVHISITDTGVGMDESHIENIFRLDHKIVSKGTNDESGTGLGLYVCKEMAEKMNGNIEVKSSLGKGSTFTLILPSA